MEDQVALRPVVTMLTEPSCLLVSVIILWYFHRQSQLHTPYPAMFFSYMQNASCNAILKAFFKINQYWNLRQKSGHY